MRKAALVLAVAAIALLAFPALPSLGASPPGTATSTPTAYTPLVPYRVFDSRTAGHPVWASSGVVVDVTPAGVPQGAAAALINLTVTNTTTAGYATALGLGGQAGSSTLNWSAGQTVANLAVVPLDPHGLFGLGNDSIGNADMVVDVEGYFSRTSSSAGQYVPLPPARITDTRAGSGQPNAGRTLGSGATLDIPVLGVGGVPASGVSAVVLNLTTTGSWSSGYFTAWPNGASRPLASNLNWSAGETRANRVVIPVGAGGLISLYNLLGPADAVVDVTGYFTDSSAAFGAGSWFTPIVAYRIADTRDGPGLGPGQSLAIPVVGVGGAVPSGTTAAFLNVTVAEQSWYGYLTVYAGADRPLASDLNWDPAEITANASLARLVTGAITVYNAIGHADVIVDAYGYFTPAAAPTATPTPTPYATPVPASLTITASSSTIPAGANWWTPITISVKGADGAPLANDPILVTASGTACALFVPSGFTDSAGLFPTTYWGGAPSAGTCTLTAHESRTGSSASTTITQTRLPNRVSVSEATVPVGGAPVQITATVLDGNTSAPVPYDGLTLYTLPTRAGGCGALSSSTATTDASGSATLTYIPSSIPDLCLVNANEGATYAKASGLVVQTDNPPVAGVEISLHPTSISVYRDLWLDAGVLANGTPVSSDPVLFSLSGTCGTILSNPGVTDATGLARATYRTQAATGTCAIGVREARGGAASGTIYIGQPFEPDSLSLSLSQPMVPATPAAQATLTLLQRTAAGAPDYDVIVFSRAASPEGACGTLSGSDPYIPDHAGRLDVVYTPSSVSGFCTITATVQSAGAGGSATALIIQN